MGNSCSSTSQRNARKTTVSENEILEAAWIKEGGYLFMPSFSTEINEHTYARSQINYINNWRLILPSLKKKLEPVKSLYQPELYKHLKYYIRCGVPDRLSRPVILKLFDIKNTDIEYNPLLLEVFSGRVLETFTLVPTFSPATSVETIISRYYINSVGEGALKRILWVIHEFHPFVKYCPMIVGFLSVLLIFLNESEAYTLTAKLLIYSRQDKEKSLRKHFMCTKAEHKNLVEVTIKIIRRDMRGLVTFLDTQNFDLNKLVSDMLTSFFVGYFRISSLTRVLTCFLSEGSKSLVRVIYGIFNSLQRELPYRQEQIEVYIKNQCCYLTSVDELLRMGFRAKINRAEYALEQPEPESHSEHLRDLFRLSIHMNSQIISVHYFDLIRSHIPTNFRNLAPKMILTNQEEKTDLRELVLRASRYPLSTAMLFIILTATGEIFGAFIDRIIEFSKKQLPISNSFIFVLEPEPKFYHANQHESFAIITKRELSLGKSEEGAALLIDGKLKNFNSISSKMYKNPSFGCRSFDIKIFESFVLQ